MKKFLFDVLLEEDNICNLIEDRKRLWQEVERGNRVVFSGLRNTGKTSIVKNIVLKRFREKYKNALIVFADVMGVRNMEQLTQRIKNAFELAVREANPKKQILAKLFQHLQSLRPTMSMDPMTGNISFSLSIDEPLDKRHLGAIFKEIASYHISNRAIIVIDEFQDIAFIEEAEGLMRNFFQELPADLPVIVLGSKKHLLSNIFASPNAPFAGWGIHLEISQISTKDYYVYINERFEEQRIHISMEQVKELQSLLNNIPESINIVCDRLQRRSKHGQDITSQDIFMAINEVVEERRSLYEEKMKFFTAKENMFLALLSKEQPLKQPNSSSFLRKVRMSSGGLRPLIKRLEDNAVIYNTDEGYVLSDPIMRYFLKMYRT